MSRTQPFQLREGHKVAYLYAETTLYRYMEDLHVPKQWFQASIDQIVNLYGREHKVTREDVYLGARRAFVQGPTDPMLTVIGTLDAPEYALFVSHSHPDGQVLFLFFMLFSWITDDTQVNFHVYAGARAGQPWGAFSTTAPAEQGATHGGPTYHEEMVGNSLSAHRVSTVQPHAGWDTVLLARLRFKPDAAEPTSL